MASGVLGTPTAWNFDPGTDIFTLQYSTARADGAGTFAPGAVTRIAVPALVYPHGYQVTASRGFVIPSPGLPGILLVWACRGASTVTVTVSPGTQGPVPTAAAENRSRTAASCDGAVQLSH